MKCFLKGLGGALFVLIGAALVIPQYSDYTARAQTSAWLAQIREIQSVIEQNAVKQKSLLGAGRGIDTKTFQAVGIELFEITESSMVILRGGAEGQVIVLIPSLSEDRVVWRCIGGSAHAVPSVCRNEAKARIGWGE
jgi:Tfp pilus assembly major pilin PilA